MILSISVPVLDAIYPIAIILIVLGLCDSFIKEIPYMYSCTVGAVGVVSVLYALGNAGVEIKVISNLLHKLPLYSLGLGWVGVAAVVAAVCLIVHAVQKATGLSQIENTANE